MIEYSNICIAVNFG